MYYLQLFINGIALGSVYSMIALGFTLIYSILKFSNFSHGGIMVISAYVAYEIQLRLGHKFSTMMLLIFIFGGLLSCFVQFIGFERLRRQKSNIMLYFVSSATLGIMMQNIISIKYSSFFYAYPAFFKPPFISIGQFTVSVTDLMMLGISIVVIIALMLMLYKTRTGIAIRALAMDSQTVQLMGVNVSLVIAITFMISGALGALAGVFCGINYVLTPQLNAYVFKGMVASVLGGLGNISGALYGGIVLGVLEVLATNFLGAGYTPVFTFLFMVAFLLVRPQGISGKIVLDKV